jgi:exodeoxyribonuclease VII large subunit
MPAAPEPGPAVLTVSEITDQVKDLLEGNLPFVWVAGEISNCTRAGSGHVYLTLKDDAAQLRAVIWKSTAAKLKFQIRDGLEVVAGGPIEVYAARGTYQITIEQLLPKGLGPLELVFRQLCERLQAEGLFATERKRRLPRFPRRIALVTSPGGAAVRDLLQVITRRWSASDIIILPVAVQGATASTEIAAALRSVARIPGVDVVITARGGGSIEDLWAFNEEIVARAIFDCPVPVISAVGHEIDITVADLVADVRAATPSVAGELVVPNRDEVRQELDRLRQRMVSALRGRAAAARSLLDGLANRRVLTHPTERIHDLARRLDELEARMRLTINTIRDRTRQQLGTVAAALQALSPLKVLERGYSVTRTSPAGDIVRNASLLQPGDLLRTRFLHGETISRVEQSSAE